MATFGRTSREVICQLWGDRVGDDEIEQLDHRKESLFRELIAGDFPAMNGAVQLIDDLHAAGFRLAVGSSAPAENVAVVLERLQRRDVFQGVVTGRDVTRGNPPAGVSAVRAAAGAAARAVPGSRGRSGGRGGGPRRRDALRGPGQPGSHAGFAGLRRPW